MQLTKEQLNVYNTPTEPGTSIKIQAYAGSGKTFILQQLADRICRETPIKRILYLAFNSAIAKEAAGKFGRNVVCRTTHSLAYKRYGKIYRRKLRNMEKRNIKGALPFKYSVKKDVWDIVNCIEDTLNAFIYSGDMSIDTCHVPPYRLQKISSVVTHEDIVEATERVWSMMLDETNMKVPMTHDGYLKLYQLSKPSLSDFDIVLVDECQDSNACLLDIVSNFKGCRIYVGDSYQQIYAFRGSTNALPSIEADYSYKLTQSFRFGDKVAALASNLLRVFRSEDTPVKGFGNDDIITAKTAGRLRRTYLSRTNASSFNVAAACVKGGIPFRYIGGADDSYFQDILDVYNLHIGNKDAIKNRSLRCFSTIGALMAYAKKTEDKSMTANVSLIKKYGTGLPDLVHRIKTGMTASEQQAAILICTAHKSKGLEWDVVQIMPDFTEFLVDRNGHVSEDEANLMYVAVTRAKQKLCLEDKLITALVEQGVDIKKPKE